MSNRNLNMPEACHMLKGFHHEPFIIAGFFFLEQNLTITLELQNALLNPEITDIQLCHSCTFPPPFWGLKQAHCISNYLLLWKYCAFLNVKWSASISLYCHFILSHIHWPIIIWWTVVYYIHHLRSYCTYLKCCLLISFIQEIYSFYCQYILTVVQISQMSFGNFLFSHFAFADSLKALGYPDFRSQTSWLDLEESSAITTACWNFHAFTGSGLDCRCLDPDY